MWRCRNNQRSGFGTEENARGERYEGQWRANQRHGSGTLWVRDKRGGVRKRYTGEWMNGRIHGYGTYYFPNGDRYEGEFVDGAFEEAPSLTLPFVTWL